MSEFKVICGENCAYEWNSVVKSFEQWDIYYLYEYTESMARHGDGQQFLLYFKGNKSRMCYPVHRKDIADFPAFKDQLPHGVYYDFSTPYGYGGPLVEGDFDESEQKSFDKFYREFCKEKHIVTQFVRYHPLLQNQKSIAFISETSNIKETIAIDTRDRELIFSNMDSKNRNMIRKAKKSGVEIFVDDGEHVDDFIRIYEQTMTRLEARTYYYFERSYYEYLIRHMGEYTKFFYAKLNDEIISSSIFFYNEHFMHYHLSGTVVDYRKYAPTNLLLYEAALWANERGIRWLHLGGGTGVVDSLFNFKKQFNKNGHLPFWIGRTILDRAVYDYLLDVRKQLDPSFDINNDYYIQYRK